MIGKGFSQTRSGEKNSRPVLLCFLAVICSYFPVQAQFSGWSYYQSVTLSVTGVTAAETNYPLLVRLTSSNSSVWANCNSSGTDIRFSDPTGVTAYPFQRAYWSYSTTTAEFWVLVPTVNISGNATTFRMYYGNPGATDASNGSNVFQTANNYQAVWHMVTAAGNNDTDATGTGHTLVPSATAPTAVTNAPVGVGIAKAFDGATSYYTANNSGGSSSSLIMPTGGPFTISCWINPLTLQAGRQILGKICTNAISTWTGSYGMAFNGSTAGDLRFNDIVGTAGERCHYQLTANTWYHLVWTRIDTGSTLANTNVYVNGTLAGATVSNSTTNARVDSLSFVIGRDAALSTEATIEYWAGQIGEVQVSNVVRDPGWATISYQTQLSTSTAVSFGSQTANVGAPQLSEPGNGVSGLSTTLILSWNTSSGAVSYGVQVSSSSTLGAGTIVFSASGLTASGSPVTAVPSNLVNYTEYYWEANASNGSVTSAWSGIWSFTTMEKMTIPLESGWFMYSLNLHPADSSTNGVFGGLKGFILAMDGNDNLYWPGATLDEIGTLHTGSGYWILDTLASDTLRLTGSPVNIDSMPISLPSSNWNLVSYLPQVSMPIATALASIDSQLVLAMDGASNFYWPAASLNEIGTMTVGNGYYILTSATTALTYPAAGSGPAKQLAHAAGRPQGIRPSLKHFAKHVTTGNFAVFLARQIGFGSKVAADNCEIGAFDTKGNLVGAGTVANGMAALAVWGKGPMSKVKNGCEPAEKIAFRLWNGIREYPLAITGGSDPVYAARSILTVSLAVPAGAIITSFNLSPAYPNPFKSSVKIAFDVPTIAGVSQHAIDIDVYDLNGCLVKQLAKGVYQAGHYELRWNCDDGRGEALGSNVYVVRMKANNFDKRIKLVRVP